MTLKPNNQPAIKQMPYNTLSYAETVSSREKNSRGTNHSINLEPMPGTAGISNYYYLFSLLKGFLAY